MIEKIPLSRDLLVAHAKGVEKIFQRAVRDALIMHKRAGNTIVGWENGEIQFISAADIVIPDVDEGD